MNFNLDEIKREYLSKILDASLNNRDYSTVIFNATFPLDDIRNVVEELKQKYNIDTVIFMDVDFDKIKNFFETNPTDEEIQKFIPKFPNPIGNVKIIYFNSDKTNLSSRFYSDYSKEYYKYLKEYNKELFDRIDNLSLNDKTVTVCPNKEWAEDLLGSQDKLKDLWIKINKLLLSVDESKQEIEERKQLTKELNKMAIQYLYFHTDLNTDFRIALNPHSIWNCEPVNTDGIDNFFNYPSYEIYTSPNCYSAEGKIVLSQKIRFYYDLLIENAVFEFSKGRLVSSKSNSELFDSIILNKPNKMNRIGEIAIVSQLSPLAQLGEFYDATILDENAGCHFALGNSIDNCIGVEKEKLEKNGARYYRYNTSLYHTDLIFGDSSICIEAQTRSRKRVLLMEKGKWKI